MQKNALGEGEGILPFKAGEAGPSAPPVAPSGLPPTGGAPAPGPRWPRPAGWAPPTSLANEKIPLESVHAYLLLSGDWSVSQRKPAGLTYSRRAPYRGAEIDVPVNQAPGPSDADPALIQHLATLEWRTDTQLKADLGRLRSMQTINDGPFHELRVGGRGLHFNTGIASLIAQTATFVVYLDTRDDVFYFVSDGFGEYPPDFGKVVTRLSILLAEPVKQLPALVRKSFRTSLAESVARVLHDGAIESALYALDRAESDLRARRNDAARLIYLSAAIPTTLLAIVADVAMWTNKAAIDALFVPGFTVAAVAASMGAVGAFLSIFLRLAKVNIDADTGKLMLAVECTLRVFVGVVVAAVVGWAINANLLLGFTTGIAGGSMGTKMLIGLLSGASERAMPTMMKKFENTIDDGGSASEGGATLRPKADQESAGGAGGRFDAAAGSFEPARVDPPLRRKG